MKGVGARPVRIAGMAAYVAALAACGRAPQAVRLPEGGSFWVPVASERAETPEEVGFRVYWAYGCAACHGPGGRGGVKNPNAETMGLIPGLQYVKEGYTEEDLLKLVRRGVSKVGLEDPAAPPPPLRMPGWEERMPPAQARALVAYLVSLYPGDTSGESW